MDREEKNKLAQIVSFELCPNRKYCITNYGEKANCYSDNKCSTIMKVVDNLINHETDLLKEFVEWLKYEYAREEHFEMEEAKDCQQKEYTYLYEYHRGREAMAEKIRDMLDQDLKKFMEDRK